MRSNNSLNVFKRAKRHTPTSLTGTFEGYVYVIQRFICWKNRWRVVVHDAPLPNGADDVFVRGNGRSWQLAKKNFINRIRYYERYMERIATAPIFKLDPEYVAGDLSVWPELAELQHHEFKLTGGCFDLSHISTESLLDGKTYNWHSHELLGFPKWRKTYVK